MPLLFVSIDDLTAENSKEKILSHKDLVEPDKVASQLRNIELMADEEAYTSDEEAPQQRNIEPAGNEDEPLPRNNGSTPDGEALQLRNNQ